MRLHISDLQFDGCSYEQMSIVKNHFIQQYKLYQMKIIKAFIAVSFLIQFVPYQLNAQTIPSMQLKSIDGQEKNTGDIFTSGQPVLLIFWATWCNHTSTGLTTIQDDYLVDWIDTYNLKVIAVSVDDVKTSNRAITVANTNGWEFEVYLDVNSDFRRAMGVNNAPHVFLFNSDGEVIWQQNAYMDGDEDRIEQLLIEESKD